MKFRRKVGDDCVAKSKADEWLEQDKLTLLEGWARDGLTDEQIANNIGISRSTLFEWRKNNQDISNALKKGKEIVDIEVENALLKRALGYKYDEVTYENGVETKRVTKEVQPDTTAQIFWLKNRRKQQWRDKVEFTGDNTVQKIQIVNDLPKDEENVDS